MSYPRKWGFLTNPKDFVGKTITGIENWDMEFGSVISESIAFQFSDGSRGWLLGKSGDHCVPNPASASLSNSLIVTPEEYAEVQADSMRKRQLAKRQEEERKRHTYLRLKEQFEPQATTDSKGEK